jgi:hypothetical protein
MEASRMIISSVNARRLALFFGAITLLALMVVVGCSFYALSEGRMCLSTNEPLGMTISIAFLVSIASVIPTGLFASLDKRPRSPKLTES